MSNRTGRPENLKPVRSKEEARERGAKGGSSPKRMATLNAQKLMKKFLLSTPKRNEQVDAFLENVGVDTADQEMVTNAALLAAKILQQAMSGDMDAIKLAFEMSGQMMTAKDQNERRKADTEREKLKILKQGGVSVTDTPLIVINKPEVESEAGDKE